MKQWTTLLLVALFSITLIAGCGGDHTSDGTPEGDVKAVVSKMFESIKAIDVDSLSEVLAPGQTKKIEQLKSELKAMSAEEIEKQKAKMAGATLSFGEVKITGDTARCPIIIKDGDNIQEDTFQLKKVDGKWVFESLPM